jgi:GNAT superfamily N-acetyltransferase
VSLPSAEGEAAHLRSLLGDPRVWCLLAEVDRHGSHWGSGLARELHAAAVEAARERGFRAIRLFTPSAHARARRFYEREGWAAVGEEFHDPAPDLVLLEYRLTL